MGVKTEQTVTAGKGYLAVCSDDEYAARIAKATEVRDYRVPGYLAA